MLVEFSTDAESQIATAAAAFLKEWKPTSVSNISRGAPGGPPTRPPPGGPGGLPPPPPIAPPAAPKGAAPPPPSGMPPPPPSRPKIDLGGGNPFDELKRKAKEKKAAAAARQAKAADDSGSNSGAGSGPKELSIDEKLAMRKAERMPKLDPMAVSHTNTENHIYGRKMFSPNI